MIRFPFNERKAAQAAAVILRRRGGRCSYIGLIKLLYLADRAALVETGMPITGDTFVSLEHGPVLSAVEDCLTGWRGAGTEWARFVSRTVNHEVTLVDRSGDREELSDYEIEVLARIDKEHGWKRPFDLVEWTHRHLPGCRDPSGTAIPIDPADVLHGENVPADRIAQIAADAEELMRLRELAASGLRDRRWGYIP